MGTPRQMSRGVAAVATVSFLLATLAPGVGAASGPDRIDPSLVRRDSATGLARVVFDSGRYLTGASRESAERIVLGYLKKYRADFGLGAAALRGLAVTRNVTTEHDGAHHIVVGQVIDGMRVHQAQVSAVVDSAGRLVLVSGRFSDTRSAGDVKVTASEAIGRAAERAGARASAPPPGSATKAKGKHVYANPYASGLLDPTPVSAELVWVVQPDRSLRPGWLTDVETSSSSWDETLVDAETGAILSQESRYRHSGPEGTVFTGQHPDSSPPRSVVAFSGTNGTWVTDRNTNGNNVNAYLDRNDDDLNNEYQPQTPANGDSAYQHFNYAFTDAWRNATDVDDEGALNADRDAAITQLFYYTNVMHDWLWGFGFQEDDGNFQVTNFSGDGTGGDPVLAEAQDGWDFGCINDDDPNNPVAIRCLNNANFGTDDADGSTARMQMYVWVSGGDPSRDGDLDGDVIAHEYGHGVSNRLVPGGISGGTDQGGSLGEGWSDTLSFLKWGDAVIGDYATSNTATGVRSVAYDNSNRTYGTYNSTTVDSPHFNGEIWASTTYDIRLLLGINTTTFLVLDGMRNIGTGPNASFLDARDGILAADVTNNGGANQCALWTAFAGRGMGENAVDAGFHAAQVDNNDLPIECRPTADADGPYSTDEGTDVALSGSGTAGSDPSAGSITAYDWDLDNDGEYDDATGTSPSFTAVGQDGAFTIGLQVTDEFGNTATDSSTVTVANVAPTVDIAAITPIDEGGTVTVTGTISDPGWLEDLSATIDFDDGNGAQPLTGVEENLRPDATLSFSINFQYGDDGTFDVEVVGSDDDTSTTANRNAVVGNVDPTTVIDSSGEQVYDGVSAYIVEAGEDLTIPVNSEDPGSDDLTFTWDWNDGTTSSETSLVNPPALDPLKSPSVQPRDVTLSATHAYGDACVYDLTVDVEDDDGGSSSDSASVLITGNADVSRGHGWWLNQYRVKSSNDFTPAELDCYLEIVRFMSLVFDAGYPTDRADAARILNAPAKAPATVIFDQHALGAWLNFANGSVKLDTLVDTDGNGTLDSTFGATMLTAETVRLNPASTSAEIKAQKDILARIITQSGG